MSISLRPYQSQAIESCINSLRSNDSRPIISMATGTGKSIVIAGIIQRLIKTFPKLRVVMATHVSELIIQNHAKLKSIMPEADTGIYSTGLGLKSLNSQITFGGIQSMHKANFHTPINLLIIDEGHTISKKDSSMWATFIDKLYAQNPKIRIVGLSATPFRMDSGSLIEGEGALFNNICFDYGLGRAIRDGWLCKLRSKETQTKFNLENIKLVDGDYSLSALEEATNIDEVTARVVDEVIAKGQGRKSWLFFCNGVKHSIAVKDRLIKKGITAEAVYGDMQDHQRNAILKDFQNGKIQAATNFGVWTTGVDIPNVDLIAMLRATMSGGLLLQMAGRGTRPLINLGSYSTPLERKEAIALSDKPDCLFLDFGENIYRHGMLDQIKAKEIKEKKSNDTPLVKTCPSCADILYLSAKKCEGCGYLFGSDIEGNLRLKTSYIGALLSGETWWENIRDVKYYIHNQDKEGKIPCLKVAYEMKDGTYRKEYVCFQHKGKALQKALIWWKMRGGKFPAPDDIQILLNSEKLSYMPIPSKIELMMEDKYPTIVNYDFNMEDESVSETIESQSTLNWGDDDVEFTL